MDQVEIWCNVLSSDEVRALWGENCCFRSSESSDVCSFEIETGRFKTILQLMGVPRELQTIQIRYRTELEQLFHRVYVHIDAYVQFRQNISGYL